MESTHSESLPSFTFNSKKSILMTTTPQKSPAPEILTPEKSDPFPRIRRSDSKIRKLSLSGSDLLDLNRTTEKMPMSGDMAGESTTLLPEKYELLCEFFIAMVNSIRLIRLKRNPATFTKLCHTISSLTDRRFTLHHLAQLKHIMPEVIMVIKIRVQDEETHCMKEELLITLEHAKETAGFAHLKGIFRSRITDYSTNHPEGDDIPEGEIPHLFYQPKKDHELSMNNTPTTLVPVSHIAPSFKTRFSSRALSGRVPVASAPKPSSCLPETPIKEAISTKTKDRALDTITEFKGTPAKLASTPARLMSSTPALRPPKRALMTPGDDANDLPTKSVRLSLNFNTSRGDLEDQSNQIANDEANVQSSIASRDLLHFLPEQLVQSVVEKERKILEEQDPVLSQARRREQLMAGVPKLFDMIGLLFQSIRCSIVTKQELIHKIVAGHLDIVDRREVEEQLNLLLELAPEYISEKSCLSGDIVLQLNKFSSPELLRAKLLEAK